MLEQQLTRLHIDSYHPDIILPEELLQRDRLCLDVSYNFHLPVFEVTEEKIKVSLSFKNTPFVCEIPFDAIWGLSHAPHTTVIVDPNLVPPTFWDQFIEKGEPGYFPKAYTPLELVIENPDPIPSTISEKPVLRLIPGGKS
jgi:hypothetical protein